MKVNSDPPTITTETPNLNDLYVFILNNEPMYYNKGRVSKIEELCHDTIKEYPTGAYKRPD